MQAFFTWRRLVRVGWAGESPGGKGYMCIGMLAEYVMGCMVIWGWTESDGGEGGDGCWCWWESGSGLESPIAAKGGREWEANGG